MATRSNCEHTPNAFELLDMLVAWASVGALMKLPPLMTDDRLDTTACACNRGGYPLDRSCGAAPSPRLDACAAVAHPRV